MRKLIGIVAAGFLAMGAGTASAATLPFSGFFSLGLGTLPGIIDFGGGFASVNGSLGGGHLNSLNLAGGTFGPITVSLPVTASATVQSVRFTGIKNQAGAFASLSGGPPGGGPMGLAGLAKICLVFDLTCQFVNVPVPFTPMAGVGFGVGGTQLVAGAVSLTLKHAPWTSGQPVLNIHVPASTVTTPMLPGGFAHDAASLTSNTAANSGTVQLVTASRVYTSLTGAFPELPVFGIIQLHFVPEPGTLLLLGSGVAGLAILGRSRRNKRS